MKTKIKSTVTVQGGFKSKRGPYNDWHHHEEIFECDLKHAFDQVDQIGRILQIAELKCTGDEVIIGRHVEMVEVE